MSSHVKELCGVWSSAGGPIAGCSRPAVTDEACLSGGNVGGRGTGVSGSDCNEKCSIRGCEGSCVRPTGHRSFHACHEHADEDSD